MSNTNPQQSSEIASTDQKQALLDQLSQPEVQQSLSALINELPKLTELVNFLTKSYDFGKAVVTDPQLKSDTLNALQDVAGPFVDCAKNVAAQAIEAKDRAENSQTTYSVFGLLKMLKDPQVQGFLRFADAFLQVRNEQAKQK